MQSDKTFINNVKTAGKILARAEHGVFIPLTVWPLLSEGVRNKVFINLTRTPMLTSDVEIDTNLSTSLDGVGFVHYLYTDQLHFGYAVEITSKKAVECRGSYINTVITKNKKGHDVSHVLNVNGFSVYKLNGDFLIAITSPNMVNHLI